VIGNATTSTTVPAAEPCAAVTGLSHARCLIEVALAGDLCDEALPPKLDRALRARPTRTAVRLDAALASEGRKRVRLLKKARGMIAVVGKKAATAGSSKQAAKKISSSCASGLDDLVSALQHDLSRSGTAGGSHPTATRTLGRARLRPVAVSEDRLLRVGSMHPLRLAPVVVSAAAAGVLLSAAALRGATPRDTTEDAMRFNYVDASQCEVSHAVEGVLDIRIDRDLRVMSDITYRSPHAVPARELLEEYERLLRANGLDLIRLEASGYVIVPAGVRTAIAPEDPCGFPSERRWNKEMRLRWRLRCPGVPFPAPRCRVSRASRLAMCESTRSMCERASSD